MTETETSRDPVVGRLDKATLDTLRMVYKKGTKVVAIKVFGFPTGKIGYVKEVLPNGNIKLRWESGEDTEIIYGKESIREFTAGKCILKRDKEEAEGGCDDFVCERCGWNIDVAEARLQRIRNDEMHRNPDGTKSLRVQSARV